jgi:hypothetical protein
MMDDTKAIIAGPRAGTMLAGTAHGVFLSSDEGSTWAPFNIPLARSTSALALSGSVLHAGTDVGLFDLTTLRLNAVPRALPAPIRVAPAR